MCSMFGQRMQYIAQQMLPYAMWNDSPIHTVFE